MRLNRKRTGQRDSLRPGKRLISAVTYREPRPVTQMRQYASGDYFSLCPRCGQCIDREYVRFCSQCGQRLSWQASADLEIIEIPDGADK